MEFPELTDEEKRMRCYQDIRRIYLAAKTFLRPEAEKSPAKIMEYVYALVDYVIPSLVLETRNLLQFKAKYRRIFAVSVSLLLCVYTVYSTIILTQFMCFHCCSDCTFI